MMSDSETNNHLTRRSFVKHSAAGLAASAAAANLGLITSSAFAQQGNKPLRLGIIGCGGRGTGAIGNSMRAAEILGLPLQLVAVADIAPDRTQRTKTAIEKSWGPKGRYAVTDETTFVGMDAYKKLCAHPDVDIVIQTTPPGLRYLTLREAVKNGKHSFVEKPVCVDSDTYRHVIASGAMAKEKAWPSLPARSTAVRTPTTTRSSTCRTASSATSAPATSTTAPQRSGTWATATARGTRCTTRCGTGPTSPGCRAT